MAYEMKTEGMEAVSEMLTKLEEGAESAAAKALYQGAGVMRKSLMDATKTIKAATFKYAKNGEKRLPSPEEKQILEEAGVGVAPFDRNGTEMNTAVGFDVSGYADVNWNHMSSQSRTNYKAHDYNGHGSMTTSTLKAAGQYRRGEQNRKPVGVIANAINSGTSFMQKQPFVRKAASSGTAKAITAMKEAVEAEFAAMTK